MSKVLEILAAIVLALHGLVHLMGTAVYMKLSEIQGFTYKTTLLAGRWDLGVRGMALFGALWALPALGFVACAVALLAGWEWWRPVLLGVTVLSLVLTVLDWKTAYAGAVINVVILALLWIGPRISTLFSR